MRMEAKHLDCRGFYQTNNSAFSTNKVEKIDGKRIYELKMT